MYSLLHHSSPKSIWVDTRTNPNLNSFFSFSFGRNAQIWILDQQKMIYVIVSYPTCHRPTRSQCFNLFSEPIVHAHVAQPTHMSALESWAQYITLMDAAQGSRLRKEKIWPQKSAPILEALKIFNQMGQTGTHNFGHPTSSLGHSQSHPGDTEPKSTHLSLLTVYIPDSRVLFFLWPKRVK